MPIDDNITDDGKECWEVNVWEGTCIGFHVVCGARAEVLVALGGCWSIIVLQEFAKEHES